MKGRTNANNGGGGYENVNVIIQSNQPTTEDIQGVSVTLTIAGGEYTETKVWEGGNVLFKVPQYANYTVSFSDVEDYITPESYSAIAVADNSVTVIGTYTYFTGYDLSTHDIYGNEIQQTTANCYVIKDAGKYKFPLVYGNALKDGEINSAAYTNNGGSNSHDFVNHNGSIITTPYIETLVGTVASVQLSIADTDGIFTNISIIDGEPCRYVQFKVESVPTTGANGIISIKNADGVIMWNWHIWVWNEDMTPIEVTNSTNVKYKLLPYNLGSKWDDDSKTYIKNWHYQFGRPTPFVCPSVYNSTSNHATYGALSFSIAGQASNIQTGIMNPTTFYKFSTSSGNWFSNDSEKTYNLWDAACSSTGLSDNNVVKTVYDPSPIGYKMPNGNVCSGFSIISNANGIVKFTRYSGDTTGIGIPMSGYRYFEDGLLTKVGTRGYMWYSAARSGSQAYYLAFHETYIAKDGYSTCAYGLSVRPVEE